MTLFWEQNLAGQLLKKVEEIISQLPNNQYYIFFPY